MSDPQIQTVFLSYTHDSPDHKQRVRSLAGQLRDEGIKAIIDQDHQDPPGGWPLWTALQIRDADIVLLICTKQYYARTMSSASLTSGLGARWEGHLILSYLYNSALSSRKFIPVLFTTEDTPFILDPLRAFTKYILYADFGELVGRIRNDTAVERREEQLTPLISEDAALSIAESLLPSPKTLRATPFRNAPSQRDYILVLRLKVGRYQRLEIALLEQFANSWRAIWKLEPELFTFDPESVQLRDIDNDGWLEVIAREWEESSISVQERLNFYSIPRRRLFQIQKSRRWGGVMTQNTAQLEITPDDDQAFASAMELYAQETGFASYSPLSEIDPIKPLLKWLAQRNELPGSTVDLTYQQGYPTYGLATVISQLDVGNEVYLAFFKGPLYCYQPHRDRHFVVFITNSQYHWVRCHASDGTRLWFGVGDQTLFSFEHDDRVGILKYAFNCGEQAFPAIEEITYSDGTLMINDHLSVLVSDLQMSIGLPPQYSEFDEA